ncbi:esterase/lipase family protein [Mesorhizobium sp. NZP2298]|uniref:esterase/lipase family protein n=1 Tax=Mesorhizobium sp. NZP2298 TaxID=2483403 RepID=UPI0015525BBC|nr:hypothetical protein [Mesorhizobium sp. NZP2298]
MPNAFPDLVVVVPGLIGSVLSKDGKPIWGVSAGALWRVIAGTALEQLELKGADDERDDLDDGVTATGLLENIQIVPGLWKQGGYSILAEKLVSGLRLTQNENYREFPYDWRRSNRVSARKLARVVPEWLKVWREKSGNPDAKVVFIAHSMGGLVARYYIECLEGWKTTRTLLSFGTPYRGSGNAVGFLCNGFAWDVGPLKAFDGTKAIRSFDSVYQLLPVYPFVDNGGQSLGRLSEVTLPNLDRGRASAAAAFHEEIRLAQQQNAETDAYSSSGPKVRPVVGIEQPTFQSAKFDGTVVTLLQSHEGKDLKGDATVPRASAIPLEVPQQNASYVATTHSALQSDEGAIGNLRGILTEVDVDLDKYREVGVGTIGLSVQDAYVSNSSVEINAIPSDFVQSISATISRVDAQAPDATAVLRPHGARYVAHARLAAGLYCVKMALDGFHPVSDVFLVADE